MTQEQRRLYLIQELLKERPDGAGIEIPTEQEGQKRLLRSLFNLRQPQPASQEFLAVQDAYLQEETRRKGVTCLAQLRPVEKGLYLWQGDITTLACGAIVNAANSQLLGCFYPCHRVHRQRHPHLRRGAAAAGVRPAHGAPGPPGAHRPGQSHPGVQPALPVCAPHRGAHHHRQGDVPGRGAAGPPATAPAWRPPRSGASPAWPFAASPQGNFTSPTGGRRKSPWRRCGTSKKRHPAKLR